MHWQVGRLRVIDLEATFAAGEELHTEISAKFRPAGVRTELRAVGLDPVGWWTDSAGDFGMPLSTPI